MDATQIIRDLEGRRHTLNLAIHVLREIYGLPTEPPIPALNPVPEANPVLAATPNASKKPGITIVRHNGKATFYDAVREGCLELGRDGATFTNFDLAKLLQSNGRVAKMTRIGSAMVAFKHRGEVELAGKDGRFPIWRLVQHVDGMKMLEDIHAEIAAKRPSQD